MQAPPGASSKKASSGAYWVLLSVFLAFVGVSLLIAAPMSRRVTAVYHALPVLAASLLAFGLVLALGPAAVCRPVFRPDLVQPWLPPPDLPVPPSKKKA
jgi:dolichyl-phosphate-mannose--protein O-mannosyl transferase